jgi:ubiquinone/menaquinone biosynthesis C-methylase UbiE
MDPQQAQTTKTFDRYRDNYSQTVDAAVSFTGLSTDFFTRVKAEYIKEIVAGHFGADAMAGLSALDVGCGVGNYHGLLKPHLGHLSGVDVSAACVETARGRQLDVAYQTYGGEKLPYADASFDIVFAICVIHHVPTSRWSLFASEMRRVLKPDGLALIFEHNPRNPLTMRAVNTCPFDADAVLLRSEDTQRLMREAGFGQINARFILAVPPANSFLRRIDRLFSRFPFGGQYYVAAAP